MDGSRKYHTVSDRERQVLYDLTYNMWNLKNNTNESIYTHTHTPTHPHRQWNIIQP